MFITAIILVQCNLNWTRIYCLARKHLINKQSNSQTSEIISFDLKIHSLCIAFQIHNNYKRPADILAQKTKNIMWAIEKIDISIIKQLKIFRLVKLPTKASWAVHVEWWPIADYRDTDKNYNSETCLSDFFLFLFIFLYC